MNYLILITIITVAVAAPRDQNTEKILKVGIAQMYVIETLKSTVWTSDPVANLKYEKTVDNVYNCLAELKKTKTFCDTFTNHFAKCAESLIEESERKFRLTNHTDVPATVISSLQSVVGYMCKTDGEHILELANPCILEGVRSSRTCTKESSQRMADVSRNRTISIIPAICDEAKTLVNTCVKPEIEKSCGNPITRGSFTNIFEAIFKPCNTV